MSNLGIWLTVVGAIAAFGVSAEAQTYSLVVGGPGSPATPAFTAQLTANAQLAGTLIGDYDEVDNPTGTRTLNFSFFGVRPPPPTNIAKRITGTATGSGSPNTRPAGSYAITVNTTARTVRLENLTTDLLNGPASNFGLNAQLSYESFLTASPNYAYPFLIPIPIPLGNSQITMLGLTQPLAVSGALAGGPTTFTFELDVPLLLTGEAVIGVNALPIPPAPQVVRVTGSITPGANSAVGSITLAVNQTQNLTDAVPLPPNLPFDLPPPTGTGDPAGVLLTADLTAASVTVNGTVALPGSGGRVFCAADLDDGSGSGTPDGGVTLEDLIYFLDRYEAGAAAADLDDGSGTGTRDGGVTVEDLLYFLGRFGQGC